MSQFADPNKEEYNVFSQIQYKIAIIGESNVGKTAFLRRAYMDQFSNNYKATIVMEFFQYKFCIPQYSKKFKSKIWDTAGDPRHRSLFKSYIQGSAGLFIIVTVEKLIKLIQKQDKQFQQEVERQIYPFVQLIQNGRNSQKPPVYYFLLSKIDLVENDDMEQQIFYKFRDCAIRLLKQWDEGQIKRDMAQSFQTRECTKLFGRISAKNQSSQDMRKELRKMVEMIYLQREDEPQLLLNFVNTLEKQASCILSQECQQKIDMQKNREQKSKLKSELQNKGKKQIKKKQSSSNVVPQNQKLSKKKSSKIMESEGGKKKCC